MNRRTFLASAAAAAAAGLTPANAQSERPNILLIMADDLGYGHLGCYGQEIIQTPNLDQLARDGMRFTQAYAGCALCAPSRSALMTGTHTGHTSVRGNTGGVSLQEGDVTFAQLLQGAGYRTGLFGKWGLGDADTAGVPNKKGFDEFFGYLHQKHAHFSYTDYLWHNDERFALPGNQGNKREQYTHDVITERAKAFIQENRQAPFFCFLSYTIPHHEWTAPAEALKQYSGKFEETPPEFRWREGYAHPEEPKATLAAMISYMDKTIGDVLKQLDELGLRENTLVLFTSDNGADSYSIPSPEFFKANGTLRGYKGDLYEGGIRVPAIVRWPARVSPQSESNQVWYFPDIFPTFADAAECADRIPEGIDGVSFYAAMTNPTAGVPIPYQPYLYWELWGEALPRAARKGDWKAVWPGKDRPVELYNLAEDGSETTDVASKHPDVVADLKAFMEREHVNPPAQIEPEAHDGRQYR